MSLQIDVVSDLVCPWCFISKRQLRGALGRLKGPSRVRWHPLQLYPEIPGEGVETLAFLEQRYGDLDGVRAVMDSLQKTGHEFGIRFDFERIARVPNTLDAHRLIGAAGPGHQDRLVELLFSAVFEQGLNISDRQVLRTLAEKAGMSARLADQALDDDATRLKVLAEQARLREAGLSAVPSLLLNRRLAVSGAAQPEVLLRAFDYAVFGPPAQQAGPPVMH